MTTITSTTTLRRCDTIMSAEISADEALAMDVQQAKYFGMRGSAATIWACFAEPATIDAVVASLLREYRVDEATCRAETKACVKAMVARSMLCVAS